MAVIENGTLIGVLSNELLKVYQHKDDQSIDKISPLSLETIEKASQLKGELRPKLTNQIQNSKQGWKTSNNNAPSLNETCRSIYNNITNSNDEIEDAWRYCSDSREQH